MTWSVRIATLLSITVLLAGCSTLPAAAPEPVFAPNANLQVQGIPPIPQSLVDRVQRYTDFRGHGFVDWHPQRREMVVAHRQAGADTVQLFRLRSPMGALEPMTTGADPVYTGSYEPREGRYFVFERSPGGNEAGQLYRHDFDTGQATLLTDPDERNDLMGWRRTRGELIYSAVPLDRTASGGTRASVGVTVWAMDPAVPGSRRKVAELPGAGWYGGDVSPDETTLALTLYRSANESQVWLLDLQTGNRRQLLPAPGEALKATHFAGRFSADGRALQVVSDRAGEFRELMSIDMASGQLTRITSHIAWDVSGATRSEDGRWLALQANVDGRDELRLFDGLSLQEKPAPRLPQGSVGSSQFDPARGELALSINSAQGPSQLYTWQPGTGRVEAWTRAHAPAGVDMTAFGEAQIVRWPSFDGRTISGLMHLPPARFSGPRPVIIDIHGGPEGQATVGFMGRMNYLIQELGVALIQPNVRGSTGFGKTFLSLDDGMKREDSVKDIGALLDWIAQQPGLDARRVMVMGGSYGGYMSLAVSVHHADRIAGAVDEVGISNFVSFLRNTESYRRDLRRAEYGDERDPAMREFLERISPLNSAGKIRKPLFVVQGKNDPRVPVTEAEQIVASVRANGTPVWYLLADNEGHGFARKENADYRFYALVRFVETVLLR